jgi:DNA mismatch repair ATPase MutS
MAELKRLRSVVDQAIAESKPDGKRMIILLDEILQGTNSRERQIAVDSVLRRLVDLGCIVLASTHDLELASNDKMQVHAQIVHFREHFEMVDGKQIMRFDYIMRSGVTPTTNALKLLELVGL